MDYTTYTTIFNMSRITRQDWISDGRDVQTEPLRSIEMYMESEQRIGGELEPLEPDWNQLVRCLSPRDFQTSWSFVQPERFDGFEGLVEPQLRRWDGMATKNHCCLKSLCSFYHCVGHIPALCGLMLGPSWQDCIFIDWWSACCNEEWGIDDNVWLWLCEEPVICGHNDCFADSTCWSWQYWLQEVGSSTSVRFKMFQVVFGLQ